MKSAAAPEPRHRLKFHWPQRPQISLALVGFLLLSVVAHGLAFYILQVVDPPGVVIPPPPVRVNLITPWKISGHKIISDPENVALLQWIDAEDPAAIATPHENVPGYIYELSYEPSAAEIRATPKSPAEKTPAEQFPPAVDTLDVIKGAQEGTPAPIAQMLPLPTEIRFSGDLAGRKVIKRPQLKFNDPGAGSRESTSFMVGVGPDGKVHYTFLLGVEMDDAAKAIDQQAEACLDQVEFSREAGDITDITWGIATYYWGNDTYQPDAAKP